MTRCDLHNFMNHCLHTNIIIYLPIPRKNKWLMGPESLRWLQAHSSKLLFSLCSAFKCRVQVVKMQECHIVTPILSLHSLTINSAGSLKRLSTFRLKCSHREHFPRSSSLTSYWEYTVKLCTAQHAFKGEPEGTGFKFFLLHYTIGNVKTFKGLENVSMKRAWLFFLCGAHSGACFSCGCICTQ